MAASVEEENYIDFDIFDNEEIDKDIMELANTINEEFEIVIEDDDLKVLKESEAVIEEIPVDISTSSSSSTNHPLRCPFCQVAFKRKAALDNHIDMIHLVEDEEIQKEDLESRPSKIAKVSEKTKQQKKEKKKHSSLQNQHQKRGYIKKKKEEEELKSTEPVSEKRKHQKKEEEEEEELKSIEPVSEKTLTSKTKELKSSKTNELNSTEPVKKKKKQSTSKSNKKLSKSDKGETKLKRKQTNIKGTPTNTKEEAELPPEKLTALHTATFSLVIDIIKEASTDKFLTRSVAKDYQSVGNISAEIASTLFSKKHIINEKLKSFTESLFLKIEPAVKRFGAKSDEREFQCKALHSLKLDKVTREEWYIIVDEIVEREYKKRAASDILLTHIINKLFYKLIKLRTSLYPDLNSQDLDLSISPQEEKILRYVAGFIPFSLLKRFKNKSSEIAILVCQLIKTWKADNEDLEKEDDNLSDYTKTWIERVDRGGLHNVNDPFYRFICRIEMAARNILNVRLMSNYRGEDLRDILMQQFERDKILDVAWSNLTRKVYNQRIIANLKTIILRKWINIRARSFVNAWIQCAKRTKVKQSIGMSDKGEPALRKTLHVKKR